MVRTPKYSSPGSLTSSPIASSFPFSSSFSPQQSSSQQHRKRGSARLAAVDAPGPTIASTPWDKTQGRNQQQHQQQQHDERGNKNHTRNKRNKNWKDRKFGQSHQQQLRQPSADHATVSSSEKGEKGEQQKKRAMEAAVLHEGNAFPVEREDGRLNNTSHHSNSTRNQRRKRRGPNNVQDSASSHTHSYPGTAASSIQATPSLGPATCSYLAGSEEDGMMRDLPDVPTILTQATTKMPPPPPLQRFGLTPARQQHQTYAEKQRLLQVSENSGHSVTQQAGLSVLSASPEHTMPCFPPAGPTSALQSAMDGSGAGKGLQQQSVFPSHPALYQGASVLSSESGGSLIGSPFSTTPPPSAGGGLPMALAVSSPTFTGGAIASVVGKDAGGGVSAKNENCFSAGFPQQQQQQQHSQSHLSLDPKAAFELAAFAATSSPITVPAALVGDYQQHHHRQAAALHSFRGSLPSAESVSTTAASLPAAAKRSYTRGAGKANGGHSIKDEESASLSRRGLRVEAAEFRPLSSASTVDLLLGSSAATASISPTYPGSGLVYSVSSPEPSPATLSTGGIAISTSPPAPPRGHQRSSAPQTRAATTLSCVNTATGVVRKTPSTLLSQGIEMQRMGSSHHSESMSGDGGSPNNNDTNSNKATVTMSGERGDSLHASRSSPMASPDTAVQLLQMEALMLACGVVDHGMAGAEAAQQSLNTPTLGLRPQSPSSPHRMSESGGNNVRLNRIAVPDSVALDEKRLLQLMIEQADDEDSDGDDDVQQALQWETASTASSHMVQFPDRSNGGYWGVGAPGGSPHQLTPAQAAPPMFSTASAHPAAILAGMTETKSMYVEGDAQYYGDLGEHTGDMVAFEGGYEDIWEVNSSAYEDSLDDAQVMWIEEQLKAGENPDGFFF